MQLINIVTMILKFFISSISSKFKHNKFDNKDIIEGDIEQDKDNRKN